MNSPGNATGTHKLSDDSSGNAPEKAKRGSWQHHALAPFVVAALAMAVIVAVVAYVDRTERADNQNDAREDVVNEMSTTRVRLEQALNKRLFLVQGLVAYVASQPEVDEDAFQTFAEGLMGDLTGIRSLQLAPDSVVTHVYPVEGNEEAIGHDLLNDPARREAVQRAIDARGFVIAGPVELLQGGVALIGRTPIFLEAPDGSETYWGLAVVLVDFDTLQTEAAILGDKGDTQYVLRGKDGLGASGEVFFGDSDIFEMDPVISSISLPNGSWQLAALPAGGWPTVSSGSVWIWGFGGLFAVITGALVWLLVSAPARLQAAVNKATAELTQASSDLLDARFQAATDAVTGLQNHRAFHVTIRQQIQVAQKNDAPLSLIMMDIDGFKDINDARGHLAGDEILREVASALTSVVGQDKTYRYGGDEFAVLLPDTYRHKTTVVAERLRRSVETLVSDNGQKVTVSLGVASFPETADTAEELVYGADAAMYSAKAAGKNRIGDWSDLEDRSHKHGTNRPSASRQRESVGGSPTPTTRRN